MEYESAIKTMPRHKLEEFAVLSATTLEQLERDNAQLRQDIKLAQTIDIEVIRGWQRWAQTLDEERSKWAETATNMSLQNEQLSSKLESCEYSASNMHDIAEKIILNAQDGAEEGTNGKTMRKALKLIINMAEAITAEYNHYKDVEAEEEEEEAPSSSSIPEE